MLIFQSIGFSLFTTVVVADRILHQTVEDWQSTMMRREIYQDADDTNDELFHLVVESKCLSKEESEDQEKEVSTAMYDAENDNDSVVHSDSIDP
jgi:hypothetical protein